MDITEGWGVDAWIDMIDGKSVDQGVKSLAFGG